MKWPAGRGRPFDLIHFAFAPDRPAETGRGNDATLRLLVVRVVPRMGTYSRARTRFAQGRHRLFAWGRHRRSTFLTSSRRLAWACRVTDGWRSVIRCRDGWRGVLSSLELTGPGPAGAQPNPAAKSKAG